MITGDTAMCLSNSLFILEPNQCNIEESSKHRIGRLKVDILDTGGQSVDRENGACNPQELDLT